MKKILLFFIIIAMMMPWAAFASADISQIGDGNLVRVEGNTGNAYENIAIEVYKGEIEDNINHTYLEGMEDKNYTSVLVCHDQTKTDENGKYTFDFNVNLKSGKYTVYLATNEKSFNAQEFIYIDNDDFEKAALLLKQATKSGDVYSTLKDYKYELGLGDEEFDIDELSKILFNTLFDYPADENSREITWANVKKALFVEKLNSGKVLDIYTIDDGISLLSQSEVKDFYKKEYVTSALKENFTQRLKSAKVQSYSDYLKQITPSFILATVNYPNGNKNAENIIKEFDAKIGVDTSKANGETWSNVAGKNYASLLALKEGFNSYLPSGEGGGGGSSSSKGGGVSLGSSTVLMPSTEILPIPKDIFTDIANVEWAKDAIDYLAKKGIVSGYDDNTFKPDNNIKREEFVKLICTAFIKNDETSDIDFYDVDLNSWYAPYIKTAYANEIVGGVGEGLFGTGNNITRQDMAVMIFRAAVKNGIVFDTENKALFEDDNLIADYAKEAVYALKNYGAINGITEKEFSPFGSATRAQAAKIIYTLLK